MAVLDLCSGSERVVRLVEVYETRAEVALVLELATGGELQHLLDEEEHLSEVDARRALRHTLRGLRDLHAHNIAHLDLKPQNLLVCKGEDSGDNKANTLGDVKLCDFGISRLIQPGVEVREIMGTPDYVAPEVLQYERLSLATDIWSVGVLTYVLLSGFSPFAGDSKQETYLNITQNELAFPQDLFQDVSETAKDFVRSCLVLHPGSRPTVEQCLDHPWLIETSNIEIEKPLAKSTSEETLQNDSTRAKTPQIITKASVYISFPDAPTTPKVSRKSHLALHTSNTVLSLCKKFQQDNTDGEEDKQTENDKNDEGNEENINLELKMSERASTIASIARCFGVEESELASLLDSADNFTFLSSNNNLEKDSDVIAAFPSTEVCNEPDEVKIFSELQEKFTEICPDYADEVMLNTRSKALEFAAKVFHEIGFVGKNMNKYTNLFSCKFCFPNEGDKGAKQARLLALCTFNKVAEVKYYDNKTIMLTPLAQALFSKDDIPKIASALNANVTDVIKTINCSAQAGGHVLLEFELHCSIVCYLVFTKNIEDKKVKFNFIDSMMKQYVAADKPFLEDKFRVYCGYALDVIAIRLAYDLTNEVTKRLMKDN
ncbi:calcium/calmodulin-dependent protein kinase type IV-like [Ctenocephalides felis]|uniref:calcium/calmodulin-dependent protein kinase type IV-like n=1 Tax=Ctenocephalides felis TaxID=7515 RepID=UPI000E6E4CA1|nr:calcium/calmodulin-dependent protein kinase type IV-like [Ctenocephalides felis]